MSKPSRRIRVAKPEKATPQPVVQRSLFLGVRRAIFNGDFHRAVAVQARDTAFSGPVKTPKVDFFSKAK